MKKNYTANVLVLASVVLPIVSFAALDGAKGLLTDFGTIFNQLWGLVITLAFLFFFWGAAQFILNAGDSDSRAEGRQKMIWGVVALFVIVSVYGVLNFISGVTGISTSVSSSGSNTFLNSLQGPNPGSASTQGLGLPASTQVTPGP